MGQGTIGILYGCKAGDRPLYSDLPKENGLCDGWAFLPKAERHGLRLDSAYHAKGSLVGFWLAIAGEASEHDGALNLRDKVTRVSGLLTGPRAEKVKAAWPRLVALAAEMKQKPLDEPDFWIVETEIA